MKLRRIGCVAHTINLAAGKALAIYSVRDVVARTKRLVTHFHHSALSSHKLSEKQKLLCLPVRKLIQSVDTRWNSTFDIMTSVLQQQLAICAVLMENTKLRDLSLESKDISMSN